MKKLRFFALLMLLFTFVLLGCTKEEAHSYSDFTPDVSDKYEIDLSDEGRFSESGELVINEAGIFHISGKATGKRIIIAAHPNAEITLSLEGASLTNDAGSVLSIERAGSVKLILAKKTENHFISDGVNRGGSPVVYSSAPVTIDGEGALSISSNNGAGAEIGGDVHLLGGGISIISEKDALTAHGSVKLDGGELSISAKGSAICASQNVEISGGVLFSDSTNDAVTANKIQISSGRCDLSCEGFVFNTKENVTIEGGEVLLSSHSEKEEHGILSSDAKITHSGGQLVTLSSTLSPIIEPTLCLVNITLSDVTEGGIVSVKDTQGSDAVKSEKSRLQVRCVSISSPSFKQGETYTVSIGDIKTKVVLTELISQKNVSTAPAQMTKHEYGGISYLLYTPAYISEELPMLVFLHGGGEKGDDLDILTLAPSLPKFLLDGTLRIDAYVIIPQLPKSEDGWYKISTGLEALIEHSRETLPVVKDKVSLTGHSMGGGGVWMLALRHPDRYSKIAPLSGWVDLNDTNLNKLKRIPVWDLVGELDTSVPPEESKPMTDALKAIGADVRSTMFMGAKHHEVPALAYLDAELGLMDWLLS